MDSTEKHTGEKSPAKTLQKYRSKTPHYSNSTENRSPNVSSSSSSPLIRSAKKQVSEIRNPNASSPSLSPAMKSAKKSVSENPNPNVSSSSLSPVVKSAKKSVSKNTKSDNPDVIMSGRNKIRGRRFVVAKKNSKKNLSINVACKCKEKNEIYGNNSKCVCSAYEILRASQEEFFNRKDEEHDQIAEIERFNEGEEKMKNPMVKDIEIGEEDDKLLFYESNCNDSEEIKALINIGDSIIKREKVMGQARQSVTQLGRGNVKNLVKAFESILSVPLSSPNVSDGKDEGRLDEIGIDAKNARKVMKWTMPGLNLRAPESEESLSFENSGSMDAHVSSSWNSSYESISSRTSSGGRSRRNSTESTGTTGGIRFKKKQLRITSQRPFKLRTELRGRLKEEQLVKKIQKIMEEQEKQRIPVAQGLPWTTDEPECLVKPPVKDITRPVDLMLHSDIRAVERAEFDHQVAEKLSFIEQFKLEKELQQKLEEEEETRRLRKELIPKAQPMPYFDRPFIPIRSIKNPTVPKTPKFNIPEHKKSKCAVTLDDMNPYTLYE